MVIFLPNLCCLLPRTVGAGDRQFAHAVRAIPVRVYSVGQDSDYECDAQVVRRQLYNATHRSPAVDTAGTA